MRISVSMAANKIAHAGTPSPTHATPKKQRLNSSSSEPDSPNHALHRRLVASSPAMTAPRASRLLDPVSPMPSGSRRSQAPDHEIRWLTCNCRLHTSLGVCHAHHRTMCCQLMLCVSFVMHSGQIRLRGFSYDCCTRSCPPRCPSIMS